MTEFPAAHFRRHRFPAEIITHAVWLYFRFPLSLRDVEDLLAERGINVSFQTVSEWAAKFGLKFANRERDEHPTFPFAIAAARTAPSPIGAERDGRRSR